MQTAPPLWAAVIITRARREPAPRPSG